MYKSEHLKVAHKHYFPFANASKEVATAELIQQKIAISNWLGKPLCQEKNTRRTTMCINYGQRQNFIYRSTIQAHRRKKTIEKGHHNNGFNQ